jgi:predicted acyltransferase
MNSTSGAPEPQDEGAERAQATSSAQTQASETARLGQGLKPARMDSLDVFRGLTIAGMILVNDPGTWGAIYWPLDHAEWNGWTPTDLIFPFFLFIVGVSMTLSFAARLRRGVTRAALARHIVIRSLLILVVAYFLSLFPSFHFATMRFPGVLPRIAVCYLIGGLFVLVTARRKFGKDGEDAGFAVNIPAVASALAALLIGYWALMRFVPVPGFGVGNLTPEGNLAAWIDRRVLYGHMWSQLKQVRDPEGLLSTLPAIGTVLSGVLVGEWLRSSREQTRKIAGLIGVGAAAMIAGQLLHYIFPINKNLWTSTFVVFTSGFAMIVLAACMWIVDVKSWKKWAWPFLVFGSNAITAFFIATELAILSTRFHVHAGGRTITWHGYVYNHFFANLATPKNASLLFAIFFVLLCFLPMWLLYRKRIFIKL